MSRLSSVFWGPSLGCVYGLWACRDLGLFSFSLFGGRGTLDFGHTVHELEGGQRVAEPSLDLGLDVETCVGWL